MEHYCGGQKRTLDPSTGSCPVCLVVCKEWTPSEIANQKAAYEAKGGVWGLNPKEPVV